MFIFTDGASKTLERAPAPAQVTPSPLSNHHTPPPTPPPHIITAPAPSWHSVVFWRSKGEHLWADLWHYHGTKSKTYGFPPSSWLQDQTTTRFENYQEKWAGEEEGRGGQQWLRVAEEARAHSRVRQEDVKGRDSERGHGVHPVPQDSAGHLRLP